MFRKMHRTVPPVVLYGVELELSICSLRGTRAGVTGTEGIRKQNTIKNRRVFNFYNSNVFWVRSRWPCGLRHRSDATFLLGLRVRIPLRTWMFFSCVFGR